MSIQLRVPGAVMSCQAVLFDMDGVLVDSMAVIEDQLRQWAREHHLDPQLVVDRSPGRTNAELIVDIASHLDLVAETEVLLEREVAAVEGIRACEGALELVAQLPSRRWAVVTSGNRPVAVGRLAAAGFTLPPVLVTADDVEAGKPDPQGYELAARRLGVAPQQCVVVEDAVAGLDAAAAAGMRAVAVSASGDQLRAPFDHLVRSLALLAANCR